MISYAQEIENGKVNYMLSQDAQAYSAYQVIEQARIKNTQTCQLSNITKSLLLYLRTINFLPYQNAFIFTNLKHSFIQNLQFQIIILICNFMKIEMKNS
ncbi:unnamed protein product [Paramecium octaurelia]|uniref:Uncharacterized protein n=1 Tax=Paramecium octaurelia TaxID=43137 RepID=A0A8S1USF0_PAROT|nr:unnamed protein product [Paramecium octaurelia]